MAKYSKYGNKAPPKKGHKIHPIWTGIGFMMIIIIPIIVWIISDELVKYGQQQGWAILSSFPSTLPIPAALYPTFSFLASYNFTAKVIFFIFLLIIISGLMSVVYAFVYRLVGPPRYAPDDIPAPRIKTKTFKR